MTTRRSELTRTAARLFAEKGYHGTSIGDLAEAMGVQKGSLYAHIASKQDLLYEATREGAQAFHAALDAVPEGAPVTERIRLALRGHLRVVAEQLDVATVFTREWRYLEGELSSCSRRRTGRTRGCPPARTPTPSRIASLPSCWTGSGGTRLLLDFSR
jgi:AcrR family transcriptional regulator